MQKVTLIADTIEEKTTEGEKRQEKNYPETQTSPSSYTSPSTSSTTTSETSDATKTTTTKIKINYQKKNLSKQQR